MSSVTEILTASEGARSAAAWARRRRWRMFIGRFPDLAEMRVLDLGGEPRTWTANEVRPAEVVLLNLDWVAERQRAEVAETPAGGWIRPVAGDACDPPAEIAAERFDLVYSNSVIEHVGGHLRRRRFAEQVRRLGEHHWIQTPNRYFPIEPHWVFPGFQFLPVRARAEVQRRWPYGHFAGRSEPLATTIGLVLEIELLSAAEMSFYFPSSELLRERIGGLTKSLIAVR